MRSVAVIGGGITGLTAAYRLRQRNVQVMLFEAGPRTGGVIHSERSHGYLAEYGPNSIYGSPPLLTELIDNLGLEKQVVYANADARKHYIVRGGQPLPVPDSLPACFKSRLFSPSAKFRFLWELFVKPGDPEHEESIADFVRRRLGTEFLGYAFNPLVTGIFAGNPEQLSIQHALPNLYEMEQQYGSLIKGQIKRTKERKQQNSSPRSSPETFSFFEGIQTLTDALQAHLRDAIRLNTAVVGLQPTKSGWVVTARQKGQPCPERFDAVLYTAPLHQLPAIRLESAIDLRPLASVYHPPLAILVLGFRREDVRHPLDGFGMLIPEIEPFRILGALFSSTIFPSRAPEGHVALTAFIGGARNPELAFAGPQALLTITMRDLRMILGVTGEPAYVKHILWEKSIPQYELGYGRLKRIMGQIEAQHLGFFMAGNYRQGVSIGDALTSGCEAAERVTRMFT